MIVCLSLLFTSDLPLREKITAAFFSFFYLGVWALSLCKEGFDRLAVIISIFLFTRDPLDFSWRSQSHGHMVT